MTETNAKPKLFRTDLSKVRKLRRDESGVTAIEFGILGLPFFAMIGAILETALVFMASSVFDSALHDAVRVIRTGEAAGESYTLQDFKDRMCDFTFGMFDCDQIKLSVKVVSDFGAVSFAEPVDPDTGDWDYTEAFSPGARKTIMVAEAYYQWDTMLDVMGFNLASLPNGKMLFGAAEVFQNEPF